MTVNTSDLPVGKKNKKKKHHHQEWFSCHWFLPGMRENKFHLLCMHHQASGPQQMNQVSLLPKMKLWPQTENWFKSKGEGKNLPSVTCICSQEQKQEESHTLEVKGSPGLSVNNSFRLHLRKMRQCYDFLENRPPTWSFTDWVREQAASHYWETRLNSSQSRFVWLHITYRTDNHDLN